MRIESTPQSRYILFLDFFKQEKTKVREVNNLSRYWLWSQDSKAGQPNPSAVVPPRSPIHHLYHFPREARAGSSPTTPQPGQDGLRAPSTVAWNCPCFLTCWLGAAESLAGYVLNQMPVIIIKDK